MREKKKNKKQAIIGVNEQISGVKKHLEGLGVLGDNEEHNKGWFRKRRQKKEIEEEVEEINQAPAEHENIHIEIIEE